MYNVIFYDKIKSVVLTEQVTGEDGTVSEVSETVQYRVPTKFVFNTATNCDAFLQDNELLDDFVGEMPSLNSARQMFENSAIQTVSGDNGPAGFPSVTCADEMFKDCLNLTSIDIDLSSLTSVFGLVDGCKNLTSFTGSLFSLKNGNEMFSNCPNLTSFDASLDSLMYANRMFKDTQITTFNNNMPLLTEAVEMFSNTPIRMFYSSLENLENGSRMFADCTLLSTSTEDEIEEINEGEQDEEIINSLNLECPSLKIGDEMFINDTALTACNLEANNLHQATSMFKDSGIKHFTGSIDSIINGTSMFENSEISYFDIKNLNHLTIADKMFKENMLEDWSIPMPSLQSAEEMFAASAQNETPEEPLPPSEGEGEGEDEGNEDDNLEPLPPSSLPEELPDDMPTFNESEIPVEPTVEEEVVSKIVDSNSLLTTFISELGSLTNGSKMFKNCKNLTSFVSTLPSLIIGDEMFSGCKLDADSVIRIANSLPDLGGSITLGINCKVDSANADGTYSTTFRDAFISETGCCSSWRELLEIFDRKWWKVTWEYNGIEETI